MDSRGEDMAPIVAALLRKRGSIELPSFGMSMYPLIQEGDVSRFVTTDAAELAVGDVCLFVNAYGIMTGHRLVSIGSEDGDDVFLFRGDTSFIPDDPVPAGAILGKWTGVRSGTGWKPESGFRSRALRLLVLRIPLTRKVLRKLGNWSMSRKPLYRSTS